MTQTLPLEVKKSTRLAGVAVVVLIVGLVVGFVLGMFFGPTVLKQIGIGTGAGTNNQVQVSGTVGNTQTGTILFSNHAEFYRVNSSEPLIETSCPIVNGQYNVILVAGHSYEVTFSSRSGTWDLYVPLGVTTFTANF